MLDGLIGAVIVVAMIVVMVRQNARLGALERETAALRMRLEHEAVSAAEAAAPAPAPEEAASPELAPPAPEPAEAPPPAGTPEPASEEAVAGPWAQAARTGADVADGPDGSSAPQTQKLDIETALGTRWAVWVGGIALALGALFLIRYSIEAGFFGPAMRLTLAGLLGLALAGAGEFLRRTGYQVPAGGLPVAHVPAILTAAGAFALFGTVYAAHALYGFIGAGLAFPLLGLIGVGAIAASLLHGQALAGVGLVGAMATPALVASTAPSLWALFIYLAIVLAAATAIARLRYWPLLAGAAFAGAGAWGVLQLANAPELTAIPLFHNLAQLAVLGLVWLGSRGAPPPQASARRVDLVACVPAFFVALAIANLVVGGEAAEPEQRWTGVAIALAGIGLVLWRPRALAILHGVGAALLVVAARLGLAGTFDVELAGWSFGFEGFSVPPRAEALRAVAAVLAVALLGGAAWAAPRLVALDPRRATAWAGWAAVAPLALLLACWVAFGNLDSDPAFAGLALTLAVALAGLGEWTARAEAPPYAGGGAVSAALAGAFAAAALMLHMAFGPGVTTVLVSMLAALAALATRWRTHAVFGWIGVGAAVVTLLRVAADPTLVGPAALGATPVLNALLPGYGLPALAFAFAAWQLARTTGGRPRLAMEAAAALFALLGAAMLVRHAMNGGVIATGMPTLAEQSIHTLIMLGAGGLLLALDRRAPSPVFRVGSMAAGVAGAVFVVVQHFQLLNPLITGELTGRLPFFNLLLLAYLMPAVAAGALAWRARETRPPWFVAMLGLLSAALAFAYATLSVRRLFHGESIALWKDMGQIETYAYSALWLAMGVAVLAAGTRLKSQVLRLGSGVLIALAVAKVFLFDMRELEGVLRALSFIGLGAVLIGIGLFYQRLLTRSREG